MYYLALGRKTLPIPSTERKSCLAKWKEGLFLDNYGYSLVPHQMSTNGDFLKVNCNVKAETILMNYLYCYIKFHRSVLHFEYTLD